VHSEKFNYWYDERQKITSSTNTMPKDWMCIVERWGMHPYEKSGKIIPSHLTFSFEWLNFHFLIAAFTFTMTSGGIGSILWAVFFVFCNFRHQLSFGGSWSLKPTVLSKTYKGWYLLHQFIILLMVFVAVSPNHLQQESNAGWLYHCLLYPSQHQCN